MDMIQTAGICIAAAVLCSLLERDAGTVKLLLGLGAAVLILIKTAEPLETVISQIKSIMEESGADSEYTVILLKSLGICYITQLSVDICRDSSENALASQLMTAGKIAVLAVSLPLFGAVLEMVRKLLE